ncbi:MAG: FHA domain-containing protein, partial [Myxococcota bacterium]
MARLVYRDRDGREQSVTLDNRSPRIYVGRNPDCQIQTTRPSVSRRHSEFAYANGVVTVRDLGSSNGTFVNGRQIQAEETITESDDIKCGDFAIRLVLDASDRPSPPGGPRGGYGTGRPPMRPGRPGVQTPAPSTGRPGVPSSASGASPSSNFRRPMGRPGRPGLAGRSGF